MNKAQITGGLVALLATAALSSVATLAVTSKTSENTDIVTMKGDTITVGEYYDVVKTNNNAQSVLLDMVVKETFERKYGDKITDKEVQEAYDEVAKSYGDSFAQVLSSNGMTEKTYFEQIRTKKLVDYAIKQAAEKSITDEDYQKAFESYTPEVTAQLIAVTDEEKAKSLLEQARAEGADFAQLAKDNNTAKTLTKEDGTVTFDSGNTDLPPAVLSAALALNEGDVSEVISYTNPTTRQTQYFIVKMVKKTAKSDKLDDYKKRLKEIIVAQRETNTSFISSTVAEALKEENVKVKDEAFANIFSQYLSTGTSSDLSSTSSTTSSSSAQ